MYLFCDQVVVAVVCRLVWCCVWVVVELYVSVLCSVLFVFVSVVCARCLVPRLVMVNRVLILLDHVVHSAIALSQDEVVCDLEHKVQDTLCKCL